MSVSAVLATNSSAPAPVLPEADSWLDEVKTIARRDLEPVVAEIDKGILYPEDILRAFGKAGAWRQHCDVESEHPDLRAAIDGIAAMGEVCGSTAFMGWCQNTLVWYIANSDNEALKAKYLDRVKTGDQLGGTGLSNPMKSFFGIEKLRLKASRTEGGWRVKGSLPWVSNLGPTHLFGTICENTDKPGQRLMILVDCAQPEMELLPCDPFLAMDGTGTYGLNFNDTFIADDQVLADDAMPYVEKIRAGFILLQAGMASGLIADCIRIMERTKPSLGHINGYLEEQPEYFEEQLAAINAEVTALCATPYDNSKAYWRRIIAARLLAGEMSVKAAHAAMLHCGARGYLKSHRAQRRLREAYFVAIVTPATKQLRKMLAGIDA